MIEFHPLVSIIIPVYNGSNYVACAIDSALAQDYDSIEVIVVNDGSKDTTAGIVKSYGDKIRYFEKENGGVSTALNMGIEHAKGDYISWLSHDDYYLSNKISRQIDCLSKINNKYAIPYSNYSKLIIENNSISKKNIIISDYATTNLSKHDNLMLLYSTVVHGCSLLIPRSAFASVGWFDKKLRTVQDYMLWYKFIDKGYLFYYIPEILMCSRDHNERDSVTLFDLHNKEKIKLLKFARAIFIKEIKNKASIDKKILTDIQKDIKRLKTQLLKRIAKLIYRLLFPKNIRKLIYKIRH